MSFPLPEAVPKLDTNGLHFLANRRETGKGLLPSPHRMSVRISIKLQLAVTFPESKLL
jgi:hypothetical protein